MKRFYHCLFLTGLILFVSQSGYCQLFNAQNYAFSDSSGAIFEDLLYDSEYARSYPDTDTPSVLIEFPDNFKFNYAGKEYDSFSVSLDGWFRLGVEGTVQEVDQLDLHDNDPFIAPFLADLGGTSCYVKYKMFGIAPSRKLVIEWCGDPVGGSLSYIYFQAWLYESTGKMEFVYKASSSTNGYAVGFTDTDYSLSGLASITVASNNLLSTVSYDSSNNHNTASITAGTKFTFQLDTVTPSTPLSLTISNVLASCMTLNWLDHSINESHFDVFRSTDNINFDKVGAVLSSTVDSMGAAYSFNDSNLLYNTHYYYRVTAQNLASSSNDIYADESTLPPQVIGVKTIPGDYASLTEALHNFDCELLAGATILELQSDYDPSIETFPIRIEDRFLSSATNTLTIRPAANVTAINISSDDETATIDLNGAKYIYFDGRAGGTGTNIVLTVSNTHKHGSVFRLINDACHDRFNYVDISAESDTAKSGAVFIAGTDGITGNDFDTIMNCNIHGANLVSKFLIYANGTTGKINDHITIQNNNLYNYFSSFEWGTLYPSMAALSINHGNSDYTITGNSFYRTNPVTVGVNSTFYGICIKDAPEGDHFVIRDNFFGGTGPLCSGNKLSINGNGTVRLLYVKCSAATVSEISNNTFQKISFSELDGPWKSMITVDSGRVDITGNLFGNTEENNNIELTNCYMSGIFWNSPANGNINHNRFAGISCHGGTGTTSFGGISVSRGDSLWINHNFFGSDSANGMILCTGNSGASAIYADNLNGRMIIDSNLISGIRVCDSHDGSAGGINIDGPYYNADVSISGNIVRNIKCNAINASVTGISIFAPIGTHNLYGNEIYNLAADTASLACYLIGMLIIDAYGVTNVDRNFIHNLWATTDNGYIVGIEAHGFNFDGAPCNITNNMITLGLNAEGGSDSAAYEVYGIKLSFPGTKTLMFNSIYIGGSSNNGLSECLDFYNDFSSPFDLPTVIKNNVFFNNRQPSANASFNFQRYCHVIYDEEEPLMDYNLYYYPGPEGYLEPYHTTLAQWEQATGQDTHSAVGDPEYTAPDGDVNASDLHVMNTSPVKQTGIVLDAVQFDFDNEERSDYKADIGADAVCLQQPILITPSGSTSIILGQSVTLVATGSSSYTWSPSSGLNTTTGDSVVASPAATITYVVTGTDTNGCKDTVHISVYVDYATVIQQPAANVFTISPNPSQNFFDLKFALAQLHTVTISNLNGIEQYRHSGSELELRVGDELNPGFYILTVTFSNGIRQYVKLCKLGE